MARDIVDALPGPPAVRQGDGGQHRQGHRRADVRQGAGATGKTRSSALEAELAHATGDARDALLARLTFMRETDMAVVVSQAQNEIADFAAKGVDIAPHRKRMVEEDLETKFKDPQDRCGSSSCAPCG